MKNHRPNAAIKIEKCHIFWEKHLKFFLEICLKIVSLCYITLGFVAPLRISCLNQHFKPIQQKEKEPRNKLHLLGNPIISKPYIQSLVLNTVLDCIIIGCWVGLLLGEMFMFIKVLLIKNKHKYNKCILEEFRNYRIKNVLMYRRRHKFTYR